MEEYKLVTQNFYNENAAALAGKYRSLFDHQIKELKHFLKLVPGKRVLDLGCGVGDHSLYFKNQGYEVKAIDYSEGMVKLALKNGVSAEVMDMEEMTFEKESFDGVWAVTSLLHVKKEKLPSVIAKIHDILVPGGVLYVCVREGRGERFVADGGNTKTRRFFAFWEKNELAKEFENHFTLESFREVNFKEKFFLEYFFIKKV
jgi:cyclopropane fatty-acyl-phospholipid synthase-like methyltransferase